MLRSILFAMLLLAGTAFAAPTSILVVGDSLSAGYGLRQEEAWPNLLDQRLQQEKLPYSVVNASISGDTTAGGRARLDQALSRDKPAVVIIALGANDGLRGLSISAMRANLDAMVESSQRAKARVLLVGMRMPPNYGPDYTRKFHESFAEVAQAHKAALVPFLMDGFAEKRDMFQPDGIHPSARAQPVILDTVWAQLRPLLKK